MAQVSGEIGKRHGQIDTVGSLLLQAMDTIAMAVMLPVTKIGRKAPAFTPGDRSYPKGYISPLAREGQKCLRVLH